MSKLDQLKTLLISKNLWAKKSLGQNFLVDQKALDAIVAAADLSKEDHVVEVGPGTGFLTEQLIQKAGQVTSIELDKDMVEILREQFSFSENLKIVNEDVLKLPVDTLDFSTPVEMKDRVSTGNLNPYKVVANIPYYITSPVIKHFLQSSHRPALMVLLVQKEVAEKVCSIKGRSFMTMETAVFGKASYVDTIPASSFYPAPKVDSAILKIEIYDEPLVLQDQLRDFLRIVKFGYSQKRKKLTNALGAGLHKKPAEMVPVLEQVGIDPGVRAEDLEIEDWKRLMEVLGSSC